MRKTRCFLAFFFLIISGNSHAQICDVPSIFTISRENPSGDYQVVYSHQQTGTYYFEWGPVGFTPGTDANPGPGGVVMILNAANGVHNTGLSLSMTAVDCYIRLHCNNTNWTANSSVFNYTLNGPLQPRFMPYSDLFTTQPLDFNVNGITGVIDFCLWTSGEELRLRFDPPVTSIYQLRITGLTIDGVPSVGLKAMSDSGAYNCEMNDSYTSLGGNYVTYFNLGPLDKGTAYDLLFDSFNSIPTYTTVTIVCPTPENLSASNITPNAIDFSWNCVCTDSVYLEYGPPGFVPGTESAPGAQGTLIQYAASPYTISGLTEFTSYDVYIRNSCGTIFSYNNMISIKTAKNCNNPGILDCGDFGEFDYAGSAAVTGAWDLSGCNDPDVSEEIIFQITPTQSGLHYIHVYDLNTSWSGYNFTADFYYKEASLGCNEQSWICLGASHYSIASFVPHTYQFGPLTAGTTYYILADGQSYPSNREYTYSFQLQCPMVCSGPALTTPTQVNFNGATINVVCNSCFSNGMIEYGPPGFTPGTGNSAGAGGTLITGVTFPYALTGLSSNTSYDIYARSDCSAGGTGFSSNSGSVSLNTCAPTILSASGPTSFCRGDSVIFNVTPLLSTWQWYRGGAPILNATSASLTVKQRGQYYCISTDNNGCVSQSNSISVSVPCIRIDPPHERIYSDELIAEELSVYPNPSQGIFKVDITVAGTLEIYNNMGALIYSELLEPSLREMDFSKFPVGFYHITLQSENYRQGTHLLLTK